MQQTRLVNNDGFLDVSCANSVNSAGSILIGHGAALDPPLIMPTAQHCEADARPRV